jgi:hypothetical protein
MHHNLKYQDSSSSSSPPLSPALAHIADAWHTLGGPADRKDALRDLLGPAPAAFTKPPYGTPQYAIALQCGWISPEEEDADRAAREERRLRSLQTCHRYSLHERARATSPPETGAYVPELSARLDDDPNLTDGARRCARKLAEYMYRRARTERGSEITVTWLMQALGKCRRTVQRYLRLLERENYIQAHVIHTEATRMCAGLFVQLLSPVFARHHRAKWPGTLAIPDATAESHKKNLIKLKEQRGPLIPCRLWAIRCMDGVFRALTKTLPLLNQPSLTSL